VLRLDGKLSGYNFAKRELSLKGLFSGFSVSLASLCSRATDIRQKHNHNHIQPNRHRHRPLHNVLARSPHSRRRHDHRNDICLIIYIYIYILVPISIRFLSLSLSLGTLVYELYDTTQSQTGMRDANTPNASRSSSTKLPLARSRAKQHIVVDERRRRSSVIQL
jgi:hypothetical protein